MNKDTLEAFAHEAAKSTKTPSGLGDHLGYEKHPPTNDSNSRNGYSSKRLITDDSETQLETPQDRDASLNPSAFVSIKLDFNR